MSKLPAEARVYTAHREKLVVYSRPNAATDNFYYRLRVPKTGHQNGYYIRSTTRTNDQREAVQIAEDKWSEVMFKLKNGFVINSPLISSLLSEYKAELQKKHHQLNQITAATLENKVNCVERYLTKYFGEKAADELTLADTEAYHSWKQSEAKRRKSDAKSGKKSSSWLYREPSRASTQRDIWILMEAYELAIKYKRIHREDKPPIEVHKLEHGRRGHFSDEKLTNLNEFLNGRYDPSYGVDPKQAIMRGVSYSHGARSKTGAVQTTLPNRANFARAQSHIWYHFMLAFGLRTNELATLKWRQIKVIEINGKDRVQINIVPKAGTRGVKMRRRQIINITPDAPDWLQELKELRTAYFVDRLDAAKQRVFPNINPEPELDEPLWLTWNNEAEFGRLAARFRGWLPDGELGFPLNDDDLPYDEEGNVLSAYSLRHTVATKLVEDKKNSIYQIAKHLGTSVEMIERYYGHKINVDFLDDADDIKPNLVDFYDDIDFDVDPALNDVEMVLKQPTH